MSTHGPERRTMRLRDFDYRQPGFYFITICVKDHKLVFGKIDDGKMHLNHKGLIVQHAWDKLPRRFPGIELDQYVIMPNHIHGIIILKDEQPILYRKVNTEHVPERFKEYRQNVVHPYKQMPVLGQIVRSFKGEATYHIHITTPGFAWQKGFYESVLSDDKALDATRFYIVNNPMRWQLDKLYKDSGVFDTGQ